MESLPKGLTTGDASAASTANPVYREFYESYAYLKDRTLDPEFLKWFIGFTEGDGHFGISGNPRGGAPSLRLLFFLVQKDRKVLEFIQETARRGCPTRIFCCRASGATTLKFLSRPENTGKACYQTGVRLGAQRS